MAILQSRRCRAVPVLLVVVLASLLAACAGNPQRAGDSQLVAIDIRFPEMPAGFHFTYRHRYDDVRAGEQLRFSSVSHPELVSDVFVYVPGVWPDHDTATTDLLADTVASLQVAEREGRYSDLEMLSQEPYTVATHYGDVAGGRLRMAYRRSDRQGQISQAHLFYVPPYTFKFRSTFPAFGNTSFDEQIDAFVRAFMADLRISKAIRCRKESNWHVTDAGGPSWVSIDGLDMVGPIDSEQTVELLHLAIHRQANNYCNID